MTPTTSRLLPHHARELHEGSGIALAIVAERGYRSVTAAECRALGFAPYQCGDGLLVPQWSLAGVAVAPKLKRDQPRTDANGRLVKYEHPAAAPYAFDIAPSARHVLREPSTPLHFTEGSKKADAAWSRGLATVSICGVFMFLRGRLVVPDLDEIALDDRPVRVVFDSDATRKPAVAEALLRFCAALHRRGAKVEVVYLPEGPGGAKVGLDDFLAGGGTAADLDGLARPWRGEGPGVWLRGAEDTDADGLRRQRDRARDDASTMVRAILNPDVSRQELVAAVSATVQVRAKQERGAVEADGTVLLTAAEIADDWRPAPPSGERIAPTNPSGTRPRLARERVMPTISSAVERGLVAATPHRVHRRHANGSTYLDTAWRFDPIPSIAAALSPWADYRPAEPVPRKPRATIAPCPECGETHPILRRDACTGCGSVRGEKTVRSASPTASDNPSEARSEVIRPSPPGPYYVSSDGLSEAPAAVGVGPAPEPSRDALPTADQPPTDDAGDAGDAWGHGAASLFSRGHPSGVAGDDRWTR